MEALPAFDVYLSREGVELSERDLALLQAIDDHGSINAAAADLGRSYSRAQQRIVELEGAFGSMVERTRGGASGGGSSLTDRARSLRNRYERLRVEFGGVTETAETVLPGVVHSRAGRLATVDTVAGTLRGLVPTGCERTRLVIRADAVTLQAPADTPAPDATSARNRLEGTVTDIEAETALQHVAVDVGAAEPLRAIVTTASVDRLGLAVGTPVVATFKATATRGIPIEEDRVGETDPENAA